MAKRKPKVTLPTFHSLDEETGILTIDRDGIKHAAEKQIKRATDEREAKLTIVETDREGRERVVQLGTVEIRDDRTQWITEAPLDLLRAKNALDRHCKKRNEILYQAGVKYRHHWHGAGLTGIGAIDLTRTGGGSGNPAWSIPTSERAAYHRQKVRGAQERMGDYLAKWVNAIVIDEDKPADLGRRATKYTDRETASAIAIEILRGGLTTLADHWGMLGAENKA